MGNANQPMSLEHRLHYKNTHVSWYVIDVVTFSSLMRNSCPF